MPPRISPDRGVSRRGRPSRGDYPGGASRGSQLGGPSSDNAATPTDSEIPESIPHVNIPQSTPQTNHPTAFRGPRPSGNRSRGQTRGAGRGGVPGNPSSTVISPAVTATETDDPPSAFRGQPAPGNRGRGRGRGASRGGAPGTPSSMETTPATTLITGRNVPGNPSNIVISPAVTATETVNLPSAFRGQPAPGNRGRGRGRGASRGGAPGTPSSVETIPAATIIAGETALSASFPHSASRGYSSRGRGDYQGSARGSTFRGRSSRGGGGGGGGFVAGHGGPTGSPSGIPGKSLFHEISTSRVCLISFLINSRSNIAEHIITFGAKRPGYGSGGRAVKIIINAFPTTVPNNIMYYQYDGEIPF